MKILVYILFFAAFAVNAQVASLQSEVNSLIKGTNTEKLNLRGYFDNKYEVEIYLIHNNSDWAGICFYPSSGTKIYLEGGLVDNKLILNETDAEGDNIGMWKINIGDSVHNAIWMNPAGSQSFDLVLIPHNNIKGGFGSSSTDTYSGKIINSDFNIVVFNIDKKSKKANVINMDDGRYLSNVLKCKNNNCTKFDIIVTDDKKIKRLECQVSGKDQLDVDVYNQFITKFTAKLRKNNTVKIDDIAFVNKKYRYYISFPHIENKNVSLAKQMKQLSDDLKSKLNAKSTEDLDNRLQISANVWFDTDFVSEEVFSGVLISQNSFDDKIDTKPINLALRTGSEIDIEKQFKSDFNYSFFVNQYLKEEIKKMYKLKSVSKWYHLRPNDFKNITLSKAGIVYSTDFNSIIGTIKIVIPFDEIKDELKRKSILKKIML